MDLLSISRASSFVLLFSIIGIFIGVVYLGILAHILPMVREKRNIVATVYQYLDVTLDTYGVVRSSNDRCSFGALSADEYWSRIDRFVQSCV
ncbi:hypothetical protein KFU94_65965 [Chloroflexi bacterium TSY]|nr:hypothetical protein [Chloroflexi bacterium TSY]